MITPSSIFSLLNGTGAEQGTPQQGPGPLSGDATNPFALLFDAALSLGEFEQKLGSAAGNGNGAPFDQGAGGRKNPHFSGIPVGHHMHHPYQTHHSESGPSPFLLGSADHQPDAESAPLPETSVNKHGNGEGRSSGGGPHVLLTAEHLADFFEIGQGDETPVDGERGAESSNEHTGGLQVSGGSIVAGLGASVELPPVFSIQSQGDGPVNRPGAKNDVPTLIVQQGNEQSSEHQGQAGRLWNVSELSHRIRAALTELAGENPRTDTPSRATQSTPIQATPTQSTPAGLPSSQFASQSVPVAPNATAPLATAGPAEAERVQSQGPIEKPARGPAHNQLDSERPHLGARPVAQGFTAPAAPSQPVQIGATLNAAAPNTGKQPLNNGIQNPAASAPAGRGPARQDGLNLNGQARSDHGRTALTNGSRTPLANGRPIQIGPQGNGPDRQTQSLSDGLRTSQGTVQSVQAKPVPNGSNPNTRAARDESPAALTAGRTDGKSSHSNAPVPNGRPSSHGLASSHTFGQPAPDAPNPAGPKPKAQSLHERPQTVSAPDQPVQSAPKRETPGVQTRPTPDGSQAAKATGAAPRFKTDANAKGPSVASIPNPRPTRGPLDQAPQQGPATRTSDPNASPLPDQRATDSAAGRPVRPQTNHERSNNRTPALNGAVQTPKPNGQTTQGVPKSDASASEQPVPNEPVTVKPKSIGRPVQHEFRREDFSARTGPTPHGKETGAPNANVPNTKPANPVQVPTQNPNGQSTFVKANHEPTFVKPNPGAPTVAPLRERVGLEESTERQTTAPAPLEWVARPVQDNAGGARTPHLIEQMRQVADFLSERTQGVIRMNDRGVEANLRLKPPDLGPVRVELMVQNNHTLTAHFIAERPETARLLDQSMRHFRDAMLRNGLSVEQVVVSVQTTASASSHDSGGQLHHQDARREPATSQQRREEFNERRREQSAQQEEQP